MATSTGARIYFLRRALDMTQETLGKKVGVTKATINKYETGVVTNLKRPVIEALAAALETTPEYLMGWTDDPGKPLILSDVGKWLAGNPKMKTQPQYLNSGEKITELHPEEENPHNMVITENQLREEEEELIKIYRKLDLRRRIKLLNLALDLESEIAK